MQAAEAHLVTSREKFEKNLESIRELVNAAEDKSNKGQESNAIDRTSHKDYNRGILGEQQVVAFYSAFLIN